MNFKAVLHFFLTFMVGSLAFAGTNYQSDSFDIYEYNIGGTTHPDLIFVAKEKILLIAGDIAIPIKYKDGESFALIDTGSGSYTYQSHIGSFNPSGKSKMSRFSVLLSDMNGDGITDMLLKPHSGNMVSVYGSKGKLPSSTVKVSSTFAGVVNSGLTLTPVTTKSGQAFKLTKNGVSWFVDVNGNPYNISHSLLGRTAIGNLKGDFTVSQGGAATYSLPIDLVSGPAGIKPRVSVNYYSQGGNGLLGKGWSLSATESITRCVVV